MAEIKSWRLRACLVLLGPLVCLLVLEGTARLWLGSRGEEFSNQYWLLDPELGARVRPGYVGLDVQGLAVEISSRGLRNPELDAEPDPARPRILVLGDSVTYGFGVKADEAYPRQLEVQLAALGSPAEVINAGVTGYTTYQGLRFLERDLLDLQPDVVLFAFMNNDRWDARGKPHDAEGMRAEYARRGERAWFYYHTALGRIALRFRAGGLAGAFETPAATRELVRRVMHKQEQAFELPPPLELEPVAPDDPRLAVALSLRSRVATVNLADRAALCERLVDLSEQHDFRVVFVNFFDHGYMCESLRSAYWSLESGLPDRALDEALAYFATAPVPQTSARRPIDFDPYANRLLVDIYDRLHTPPEERAFYFTRRPSRHLLLHLDAEVNAAATQVALERGVEVVEFPDLEFRDYLDHVHLTPHGHEVVATRLARLLAR